MNSSDLYELDGSVGDAAEGEADSSREGAGVQGQLCRLRVCGSGDGQGEGGAGARPQTQGQLPGLQEELLVLSWLAAGQGRISTDDSAKPLGTCPLLLGSTWRWRAVTCCRS